MVNCDQICKMLLSLKKNHDITLVVFLAIYIYIYIYIYIKIIRVHQKSLLAFSHPL